MEFHARKGTLILAAIFFSLLIMIGAFAAMIEKSLSWGILMAVIMLPMILLLAHSILDKNPRITFDHEGIEAPPLKIRKILWEDIEDASLYKMQGITYIRIKPFDNFQEKYRKPKSRSRILAALNEHFSDSAILLPVHHLKQTPEEIFSAFQAYWKNHGLQHTPGIMAPSADSTTPLTHDSQVITPQEPGFLSLLTPRSGFVITPLLVYVTVGIFILMAVKANMNIISPDTQVMLQWGANFRPYTLDGQWWRLVTSMFLHLGIIHLLFNMYALLYIGFLLEPLLGKQRFLMAYFVTGTVGSLTSLAWHEFTVSAGASGAIFGMYGAFLALLFTNIIPKQQRSQLLSSIGVFVAYSLVHGMKGGIDNAAHLGGLLAGLVIGGLFYLSLRQPSHSPLKYATFFAPLIIVGIMTTGMLQALPNTFKIYQQKLQEFDALEEQALAPIRQKGQTDAEMLRHITEVSIPKWQQAFRLLEEAEQLPLPESLHAKNRAVMHYAGLRTRWFSLLSEALQGKFDIESQEFAELSQQIDVAIKNIHEEHAK